MPSFLPTTYGDRAGGLQHQRTSPIQEYAADSDAAGRIRRVLSNEMQKARRSRHWYRLSRQDRAFFGLALRLRVKFEGPMLLRALVGVLKRLKELGDRAYLEIQRGSRLAWLYSEVAVGWGNAAAREWRNSRTYILFLGGLCLRSSP